MTDADRLQLEQLLDVLRRDVRAVRSRSPVGLVVLDVEDAEGLLRLGKLAADAAREWRGIAKRAMRCAEAAAS